MPTSQFFRDIKSTRQGVYPRVVVAVDSGFAVLQVGPGSQSLTGDWMLLAYTHVEEYTSRRLRKRLDRAPRMVFLQRGRSPEASNDHTAVAKAYGRLRPYGGLPPQ